MRVLLVLALLILLTVDAGAQQICGHNLPCDLQVRNNTNLKALVVPTNQTLPVLRQGFASPGDGGAAYYNWSASSCSLNSGNGDNGYQVKPNTGGGCWIAQIGSSTDVRVWGAPLGTSDDTAIWTAATNAMLNAGFNTTLECNTSTNLKNWIFYNNNFILQGNGACTMNAPSSATTGDVMISYQGSGPLRIDSVNFVAPIFNFSTYATPVINKFIRVQQANDDPVSKVHISNISAVGAQQVINANGADYVLIENFFFDRQSGDAMSIGTAHAQSGSLKSKTQHVIIKDGWCRGFGSYCWTMPSQIQGVTSLTPRDLIVSNVTADFGGFIQSKYCADLVGDALTNARVQMVGHNCRQGGIEIKGNPDGVGVPNTFRNILVDFLYTATWDGGFGLQLNYEQNPATPNLTGKDHFKITSMWYAPGAWMAGTYYDVGDSVQSNGFTFIAIGPGTSSLTTGPTSNGVLSATVSTKGTGYGTSQTGNITWSSGGGGVCTVAPVLNVTSDSFGQITTVNSVTTPGTCSTFPVASGSTWTASAPLSAGTGATFTLTFCNNTAGNAVVDGTVTWICIQPTPLASGINASTAMGGALIEATTDVHLDVTAYNTSTGVTFTPRGSSDSTIRNLTVRFTGTTNNACFTDAAVPSTEITKVGTITGLNIVAPSCTCGRTDGGQGGLFCVGLGLSNSSGNTNNFDMTITGGIIRHQGAGVSSSNRGTAIQCTGTSGVPPTMNVSVVGTRLVGGLGSYNINGCNWTSLQTSGTLESTNTSVSNDLITITETVVSNSATVFAAGSGYTASASGTMTWSGAGCAVNPVLNVTSDASGIISAVSSVATPGVCGTWPAIAATTWTASAPLGAGTNAAFNYIQTGEAKAAVNVGGTGYGTSQTGIMTWSGAGCSTNPQLVVSTNSSGVISTVNAVAVAGVCTTAPSPTATTWTAAAPLSAGSGTASFNYLISPSISVKTLGPVGTVNIAPATKTAWSTNGVGVATAVLGAAGAGYGASVTGTMTWSGAGCSTNPVLFVSTTGGGAISAVKYVLVPGVCTTFPSSSATTWTPANGLSGGANATFTMTPNVLVSGRFVAAPSSTFPTAKCNWGEEIPIDPNGHIFSATAVATGNYICALPGTSRQWLGGIQVVGTAAETNRIPVCSTALTGLHAFVTDQATAAAYRGAVTSGAGIAQRILCDGTNWIQD